MLFQIVKEIKKLSKNWISLGINHILHIQLFISPLATQLEETISYSLVSVSFFHLYIHPLFFLIDKRYDLTFLYVVPIESFLREIMHLEHFPHLYL